MTRAETLATALADAMLDGPWEPGALRARCRRALARRPGWIAALVAEVCTAYPRPPADRPREFAAFIALSAALQRAEATRPLPAPVHRFNRATAMVRHPFPTPVLHHVGDLADHLGLIVAELDTLADPSLRARRARTARIAHYRYQWVPRPTGARLLEAPRPRLAAIQRRVLDELIGPLPVHPAAHGFVAGRSALTGARAHVGASVVITLDLEHYFSSITAGRIWGVLRSAGYPEPVAYVLTGLTTHASSASALARMPPGPDRSRDFRLRRRLAAPHLPQGAPASPYLANLVTYSLDRRLAAYAEAAGAAYTRYADDLTFSGGPALARRTSALIDAVQQIVREEGFRVNVGKTRARGAHQRQVVTGIVVNDRPNLARPEFDRLRAILHESRVRGPALANRHGHPDFRAHLLGRISWAAALNPDRGRRLRALFDRVEWDDRPGS